MSARLPFFFTLYLIVLLSCVFPAAGISIGCSSGGGGESVSSSDTFDLDDSTSLQESISLDFGSISKYRDASGSGNNSVDEYISGTDFSLQNSVQSAGSFGLSSSASATAQSGSLAQDVAGTGSMSISLSSAQGSEQANQGASVTYGALDSMQAIAAGEGVYAAQSTGMAGLEGSILSGAVGSENVMGATGTFTGAGLLEANLAASTSAETGRAFATGTADLDGTTLIDGSSFQAVSSQSLEMCMEGLRDVGDGDVGGFDVNVLNLEKPEMESTDALTSTSAASTTGGSYSSYVLTGYRWNQANPQIQLYLNTNNAPTGITATDTQSAVSAAANTWDDAVSSNLFADGTTVIVDNSKTVDNPFSSTPLSDGKNVVGWANMGSSYLGMCRWWSNGATKEGYKSILEADTWFASDKKWTTDLSKATGSTFDIQSVAVHELGHTIGLGDLYTLPSSDSRKYDWNQVMNSYDGAQRTLGNGDLVGAQILYGNPDDKNFLFRMWNPRITDHLYTLSSAEYSSGAINCGYGQEGVVGYAYSTLQENAIPLYRMWNPYITDHLYTTSYAEYSSGAINCGYGQEGIMGYIFSNLQTGTIPVYRMWNPYICDHLYTTSYAEYSSGAINYGYGQEGIIGYIMQLN